MPCRSLPDPQPLREAYQRDKGKISQLYDQQLYDLLDKILTSADKRIQFSKTTRDSKASELQECPQVVQMDDTISKLLGECRKCGLEGDVTSLM
jgi:thymidine kinase